MFLVLHTGSGTIDRWTLGRHVLVLPRSHDEDDTKREVDVVERFFQKYEKYFGTLSVTNH